VRSCERTIGLPRLWRSLDMARASEIGRRDDPREPLAHGGLVGARSHHALQRRMAADTWRNEASGRARPPWSGLVAGDLAHRGTAVRACFARSCQLV
jgi:hypothetical protein